MYPKIDISPEFQFLFIIFLPLQYFICIISKKIKTHKGLYFVCQWFTGFAQRA